MINENPLFGRFDEVVQVVLGTKHTPQKLKIGDFFGDKKQLTD
jgi:hypothetical protein